MNAEQRRTLDEVARDLDLLVFRLEASEARPEPVGSEALLGERKRLRRDLERLRDRLQDVVDGLW